MDLSDKTDSLMVRPSDKKQLQFSDDKIEGARKMKEFADQEISSANVQIIA